MPQIVLYHLVNSRSERLFWALEAMGLPYTVKVSQRTAGSRAPKNFAGTGKAPAVELDGEILSESGYILSRLAKLARQQGKQAEAELEPSNSSEYYTHFAEGTMMLWMQAQTLVWLTTRQTAQLKTGEEGKKAVQDFADWCCANVLEPESQAHIDQLEEHLSKHDWLSGGGKPGIGDFMLTYPLLNKLDDSVPKAAWQRQTDFKVGPGLKGWLQRVKSHPAYQRGAERQRQEEAAAGSKL